MAGSAFKTVDKFRTFDYKILKFQTNRIFRSTLCKFSDAKKNVSALFSGFEPLYCYVKEIEVKIFGFLVDNSLNVFFFQYLVVDSATKSRAQHSTR